jgi:hypothetical protein
MKTPKRMHAKKIAAELAHYWTLTNYTQRERGDKEYTLEWMLADAWLRGFEAGRRDEKQRQKEKGAE